MSIAPWHAALADHQRTAAARAIALLRRYRGVILADEVGLGKSYVAAAVAAEARSRHVSVELIVPATLVTQWAETLALFGVSTRILTHAALINDPFVADPACERLVIVDEAHVFRNPQTLRYGALARRTIAARTMLVTATPVCNSAGDLHALLSLIVPDDALGPCGVASIDLAFANHDWRAIDVVVCELVIRRGRDVLPEELQFGRIAQRIVQFAIFTAGGEVNRLIDSLAFPLVGEHSLLRRFLWRRLESSEAALSESIRRQLRFYERALESLAGGRTLTKRDYRCAFGHEEDREAFQQVLFWELWSPSPATDVTAEEIRAEMDRLFALRQCVEASPRVKEQMLVALCAAKNEPMLIFTSSAATARSLAAAVGTVRRTGLVTSRERSAPAAMFRGFREGRIDVLVTTDLAAEGLNLQRAAAVVHYDLPWNPVKLDQRNGRAHRIGQRRSWVEAIYFLPAEDETGIVRTIAAKNQIRQRLLALRAGQAGTPLSLRPRIATNSAIASLLRVVDGSMVPEWAERRHKAGIERLIAEMSREIVDRSRIEYLASVLAVEAPI